MDCCCILRTLNKLWHLVQGNQHAMLEGLRKAAILVFKHGRRNNSLNVQLIKYIQ